jgi:hypothetical protein
MTRHELIDAFVSGKIGRRDFVRRMTALGVSAGAALAYANTLVPGAAAAGPASAPYVMRFQAQETVYGTACTLTSDADGATAVDAALQQVAAILNGMLDAFDDTDIPELDALEQMSSDLTDELDAVGTVVTDLGGTVPTPPPDETFTDPDEALSALFDALSAAVALFAGVVPAISDGEARQTLMNVALAVAANKGFAAGLAGEPPVSGPVEQPVCP